MITYSEYWQEIQSIVESIKHECESEGLDPHEFAHELIDSHEFVIYTYKAMNVLVHSDHSDAWVDHFGETGVVKDNAINWSGLAYMAMMADVQNHTDWEF